MCVQLISYPDLQHKIHSDDIKTFTKKVLPRVGTASIPFEIIQGWYRKINNMTHFEALFDLARSILEEGNRMKGRWNHKVSIYIISNFLTSLKE